MSVSSRLLFASLFLVFAASVSAVSNPNFAPEQSYAGTGDGTETPGPDGWTLRDLSGRALVSTVDFALAGERVFWFETLTGGFGDNKLEQCASLSDPSGFAVTVHAWTATPDSDLRVRLNAEYYSSEADCLARSDRLDDVEEDFRLDGAAETWAVFTMADAAPPASSYVRLSLRARDRTGAGNNPADEPKFIYFDNISFVGGTVSNGDFEDTSFTGASFSQDQGPFGWTLRSVLDQGLVVPEATAALGSAFRFSELGNGFGDNTLEQCVAIAELDPFVFDVSIWPNLADADLAVRLAVDLHANLAECIDRSNRLARIDSDFTTQSLTPASWNALRGALIDPPAAAEWARIALRARDQRPAGPDPIILFDRVALTDRFLVGGTVSGLASGAELTLDNNGESLLISANGSFAFPTALAHDAGYAVTVTQQPLSPSQTCTVSAGDGQIDADDVTDIEVTCTTNSFTIGGTVEGLEAGNSVVLQLNDDSTLTVSANEAFSFAQALLDGSTYAVTVLENPSAPDQTCTVANGEGVLSGSNIDDVLVTCATDTFSVGGSLSNLVAGTTVVLQNNGGDDLALDSNGAFSFSQAVADGAGYAVTVLTQPSGPNQFCEVSNGSGAIAGADVDNVLVDCQLETYSVGGSLSGLADGATVSVQLNAAEVLDLSANGSFQFTGALADGSAYSVAVLTQPSQPNQLCTITNASGSIAGGPVDNVMIDCVTETYAIGGTLSGLAVGNSVVLQNNGADNLTLSSNGSFEFATELDDGSTYAVTVLTQPASPSQTCTVSQGSGTLSGAAVSDIEVTCATDTFLLGGFLSGLAAGNSLSLNDGAGQSLLLDANGAFVFAQALADGSSYAVSVAQQPSSPAQICSVTNASGTIAGADVTNIEVACVIDTAEPGPDPGGFGRAARIINPSFGLEQAYAGSSVEFPGPAGWVMRDLEDRRGLLSTVDFARAGSRVFRFESPQRGFGDNKLDQCLPLTDPAAFALRLHAWSSLSSADVEVRVNIESYPSAADCAARSNRLDNSDFDFPLTGPALNWQALELAQALNPSADHARISLRMRDRSNGGDPAEPPITVLFDDISAVGATVQNGDFAAGSVSGALFGPDQGPLGWTLRTVGEFGLVLAEPTASGGSAFQFTQLSDGFGDNSLEQCVAVDMSRMVLSASVWPELSNPDLRIRLNIDLHANLEDCLNRDNRLARFDTDFRSSDLTPATWNTISTRGIARPAGAGYARIALRARDRVSPAPASPPIILFDQVRLTPEAVAVPVNHPLALGLLLMLFLGLGIRYLGRPRKTT